MIYLTGSLKKFAKQVAKELDNCGQLIAQLIINYGISSDPGKYLKLHQHRARSSEDTADVFIRDTSVDYLSMYLIQITDHNANTKNNFAKSTPFPIRLFATASSPR